MQHQSEKQGIQLQDKYDNTLSNCLSLNEHSL